MVTKVAPDGEGYLYYLLTVRYIGSRPKCHAHITSHDIIPRDEKEYFNSNYPSFQSRLLPTKISIPAIG
jgi:hypothetical protein